MRLTSTEEHDPWWGGVLRYRGILTVRDRRKEWRDVHLNLSSYYDSTDQIPDLRVAAHTPPEYQNPEKGAARVAWFVLAITFATTVAVFADREYGHGPLIVVPAEEVQE